ncbi:hypothetical protein QUC31_020366 [Theobroma cacao]|uniref:Uncharacterized protein LOC18588264 n=2 Tax=Theobroma cacao TaxID=3641 RepID=A0AB32UP70_THECC|nr:PREDICTED: uncharacterized protein LOC18588264 [Theobroma cacao]EOY30237.1 Uncharacterized protein TCM_037511 [Theobroma cacao]WRX33138.1 Protein of unknown function DUF1677 [Theobroma cacao]
MAISGSDTQTPSSKVTTPIEIHCVKCESCGFTEECTTTYILRVRERYQGRWICGLCIEAVKDEALRSDTLISTEEALDRHISFCKKFRASSPSDETEHPISVMGRILRRSLDSPRALRSNSSSVLPAFGEVKGSTLPRSESCFPALSG